MKETKNTQHHRTLLTILRSIYTDCQLAPSPPPPPPTYTPRDIGPSSFKLKNKHLELEFHGLSSEYLEFFDKISVRILLDVLFRVFRFSKASFLP